MTAPYQIERKVSHQEWVEIVFDADTLLANAELFKDEDGYCGGYPTLSFENDKVTVDESWGFDGTGHIYTSSSAGGIVDWDAKKASYVKSYYGSTRELGALVSAAFMLTDKLRAKFGFVEQSQ